MSAQMESGVGSYSPYSLYGIGDIKRQGSSYNQAMGGIGISLRDNAFINYINPASISARDSLTFMLNFGVSQANTYMSDANGMTPYNTFNLNNFVFTFPVYKKSAFVVGLVPFADTGYEISRYEDDPAFITQLGTIKYRHQGIGGINKLFTGASTSIGERLSVGAELIYYFGSVNKQNDILFTSKVSSVTGSERSIQSGISYESGSFSGKFGLQYEQPIKENTKLGVGVTYSLGTNLNTEFTEYTYAKSDNIDTVKHVVSNLGLNIAPEIGVGISYEKRDRWLVGFDYLMRDWRNTVFFEDNEAFTPMLAQTFNAGFQYIPNKYDSRYYFRRVTYRGGAYYDKSYMGINDEQINSYGITFGASFPIYRWSNSLGVAIDVGQRASSKNTLVKENM